MCVSMCMSANHYFPTTANVLPDLPAPQVYTTPRTQNGYCLEHLCALMAPVSKTVLKISIQVSSFVPSEGYVLFQTRFTSLMNNAILPASFLTFLHCKFSTEMKTSFVSCGLIKDSCAMSRFTCENIFRPLTIFISSS